MASGSVSEEPNSQIFTLLLFSWNLIIDTSEMHTLNKLSRVFGTNMKTILCNNPNMTLKIQVNWKLMCQQLQ